MRRAEEHNDESVVRASVERASGIMIYYAAERTLMAWIRVALAMMALGFVVDRFGLVLRMMPHMAGVASQPATYSFWTGSVLVFGGSVLAVVAAARYIGLEMRFRREGCAVPGHGLPLGVLFTLFTALVGVAIGIFLVTVRY